MRIRTLLTFSLLFVAAHLQGAITGSLMTTDGQPVAGATVTLARVESSFELRQRLLAGAPHTPLVTAQSDAKGVFKLESPKEPVLNLHVSAPGFGPLLRAVVPDEELGAIPLTKTPLKSGTVRAAGKPVAGAKVVWFYRAGMFAAELITVTDEQGRYSAPDAATASRRLVIHPDFAIDNQVSRSGPIPFDVTLRTGSAYTGRVVAPGGSPVPGAQVFVDGWPLAKSGEDGTFTIAHMAPDWRTLLVKAGSLAAVRFAGGKTSTDLLVSKAATVSGTLSDAKSRLPIPGALVQVAQTTAMTSDPEFIVSDGKGRFSFLLPAGNYRLMAAHPNYSDSNQQLDLVAGASLTRDKALSPFAMVSGTVTDEQRKPVVAATVGYENPRNQMFDGPPSPAMTLMRSRVRSGADGRFMLRIPESEVHVTASKKGLPTAKSDKLKLAAGEKRSGVTLVLPLGFAVTGKVTDGDGRPLSGVTVDAVEAAGSGEGMMFRRSLVLGLRADPEETVETASDGTFTLRLQEGKFDVAFRREGWSSHTVQGVIVSGRTPPVEVTLQPSVDIAGRVVRAGVGVEGVTIYTFGPRGSAQATTGADGSFVLRDVVQPDATAAGGIPVQLQLMKMDEFIRETRNITAPATNALIELPPGGRVSGRVIDKATRAPVTTFQAGLAMSRAGAGMNIVAPPQLRSISSDDGSFTLDNVPAGVVSIVVNAPGYVSGRSGSVTLEEGKSIENVEVELDRGARLTGRVTGPDGAAVAGAYVREMTQRSVTPTAVMTPSAMTDGNGEYAIEAIEPGEKMIEFAHRDFAPVQKSVKLSDRETRLDVQFEGGPAIAGIVVNESGSPVAGATVRASGAGFGQVLTETDGTFKFNQLRPGRYTFTATGAGLAPGTVRDFDISSGQQIRITMPAGATIYGRVSGVSPAELQRTNVMVGQGMGIGSPVDASGNYRIEGVSTGKIRVSAIVMNPTGAGRVSSPVEVEIAPGETRQVDVEFKSGATITGRVTRSGQPLASVNVTFRPKPPLQTFASAPTNEQGVYTVTGLEDGEYSVGIVDMQRLSPASQAYTVRGSATFDIDLKAVTVRGRVTDASNGEPVREPRIQLRPEGTEPASQMSGRVAMADANGTFVIDYVAPGRYSAYAEKEGYASQPVDITVTEGGANEIDLRLSPTAGVKVRIVDARDGKPVTGSVSVRGEQGRSGQGANNYGNPNGEATLFLPPGAYTAVVMANGYASRTISITSPGGAPLTVALSAGGTIEVKSTASTTRRARLVDASGTPYNFGNGWGPFTLQPTGFTLRNIAPGNYTVQILGEGDAVVASVQVTVVAGQTAVVSI